MENLAPSKIETEKTETEIQPLTCAGCGPKEPYHFAPADVKQTRDSQRYCRNCRKAYNRRERPRQHGAAPGFAWRRPEHKLLIGQG